MFFTYLHGKKIQCDKSGDLGGQATAAPLLIHPPGIGWCKIIHISSTRPKKLSSVVESSHKGHRDSGEYFVYIKIKKAAMLFAILQTRRKWSKIRVQSQNTVWINRVLWCRETTFRSQIIKVGCWIYYSVWVAMLQSAKCGATVVLVDSCVHCAMTDENQTYKTDFGSRLGSVSVIVSDLFLR